MTRRHFLAASCGTHLLLGSTPQGTPREVALAINLGGRHVCSFQNGYLLVSEIDRLTVTVVDERGNVAGSFRPSLSEAALTAVLHGAVSPDGTVVVAAEAQSADGRYANLLVFTDLKGSLRRVVRTSPFAAIRPRFLSDGRLLCVGRELDGQLDEVPGFHLFRFYSPEGRLLETAVPIDVLRPNRRDSEPTEWEVAVAPGRIGLLDYRELRYVEFNEHGEIIRPLERLGFDPPARANGFALLSNGALLIAVIHQASRRGPHRFGLYLLRDTGGRMEIRQLTGIGPAEGYFVAGVHRGEVALFTSQSMFFVPESAL